MSDGQTQVEQHDANTEILEEIRAGVRKINTVVERVEKLEITVAELSAWRAEHQPWSEDGRKLIEAQTTAIIESRESMQKALDLHAKVNGPTAWRNSMAEVLHEQLAELLPKEIQTLKQREQTVADQEFGKAVREWKERNLTPMRALSALVGLMTLLASPQLIIWTLNRFL